MLLESIPALLATPMLDPALKSEGKAEVLGVEVGLTKWYNGNADEVVEWLVAMGADSLPEATGAASYACGTGEGLKVAWSKMLLESNRAFWVCKSLMLDPCPAFKFESQLVKLAALGLGLRLGLTNWDNDGVGDVKPLVKWLGDSVEFKVKAS